MNLDNITQATTDQFKIKDKIEEVEVSKIFPNPDQPKKHFSQEKLESLSASIVMHGLLQPIIVKRVGDKYEIVGGERRWRAVKLANIRTIKANIITTEKAQEIALIENIQRDSLTDYETAVAINKLWEDSKYPLKQDLAQAIGKTSQFISKCLRVLELDDKVQKLILGKGYKTSTSVLIEIAKQPKKNQMQVLEDYVNKKIKRDEINPKKVQKAKVEKKEVLPMRKDKFKIITDSMDTNLIISYLIDDLALIDNMPFELNSDKNYEIIIKEI